VQPSRSEINLSFRSGVPGRDHTSRYDHSERVAKLPPNGRIIELLAKDDRFTMPQDNSKALHGTLLKARTELGNLELWVVPDK
jgi:hypothetical protein